MQSSHPHEKGLTEDEVRLIKKTACISGKLLATPLKCQSLHELGCFVYKIKKPHSYVSSKC